MRQLAYVGEDGQIRVADLDQNREVPITGRDRDPQTDHPVLCNWPTWSPNGDAIAYFRYELAGEEVQRTGIHVATPDGSASPEIYALPVGAPIYMCWSPDGQRLAVLVQESRELYLRVIERGGDSPAITVAQGAPLYFAWHPDSPGLVIHTGGGGLSPGEARLVWVRLEGGQATYGALAGIPAADFRAPAWAVRRGAATVALAEGDGAEIVLQSGPDADRESVARTGSAPAFLWSPDGERLAFAARAPEYGGAYGPISVFFAADGSIHQVTEDPGLAFFWCPDSVQLVYSGGEMGGRMMNLRLVNTATGDRSNLGWVRPSRDVMLLLGHFDQ